MKVIVNLAVVSLDFMTGDYFVLHNNNHLPSIEIDEDYVDLNIEQYIVPSLSKYCVELSTNWMNFFIVNSYFDKEGNLCVDYGTVVPLDSKIHEPYSFINTKLIELDSDDHLVTTIENTIRKH